MEIHDHVKHMIYDFATEATRKAKKLPADAVDESIAHCEYLQKEIRYIVSEALRRDENRREYIIKDALSVARDFGGENASHHMQYCIDKMVRVLTSCPMTTLINQHGANGPFEYQGLGESEEYKAFKSEYLRETNEAWDAGISP